ncbi:MAG: hydantoinase/oxoprolinase family protein [Promethearchaeota archaeon]
MQERPVSLRILGLDIGGANTKAALLEYSDSNLIRSKSFIKYFPFWEKSLDSIPEMLNEIIDKLIIQDGIKKEDIDFVAITITAELSDAFRTKREGIQTILTALEKVFKKEKMRFINVDGKFINFNEAISNKLSIAAANWVSTALFLGKFMKNAILIDAGSTTIDIIPILNSRPITRGKTDVERLIHHELIYTGGLRATIPSITHHVPYKNKLVRISFEKFALVSDIHRILNNISEREYINDTADNRSKSLEDCYARLARIICLDLDLITKAELDKIAKYIYKKQLEVISKELSLFIDELIKRIPEFQNNLNFVLTGLSADFLVKTVLLEKGYDKIFSYEELTGIPDNVSSSAFAVAGAFYNALKEEKDHD